MRFRRLVYSQSCAQKIVEVPREVIKHVEIPVEKIVTREKVVEVPGDFMNACWRNLPTVEVHECMNLNTVKNCKRSREGG